MKPLPEREREALITLVATMYFEPAERRVARQMLKEGKPYEETIAYLVRCGEASLRKTLPLFLTIPGGRVHITRPDRGPSSLAYIAVPLDELARHAFPPVKQSTRPSHQVEPYKFFEVVATRTEPAKRPRVRAKKHTFVEQSVHIGTRKLFREQVGWIIKKGGLATSSGSLLVRGTKYNSSI